MATRRSTRLAPASASGAAGSAASDRPGVEEVKVACIFCRPAKVRCEKGVPCRRCAEKSLPCRPYEGRNRGRPRADDKGDGEGSGAPAPAPIVDLVLAQANPKGDADMYIRCFHQLYDEGRIVRDRVIKYMRHWQMHSALTGKDSTWGIAQELTRLLKISPVELEQPDDVALEPDLSTAQARVQEAFNRLLQESRELQQSAKFRRLDNRAVPFQISIARQTGTVMAMNEASQRLVLPPAEIYDHSIKRNCISILIAAAMVVPQDRELFFRGALQMLFTDREEVSSIVKAFLKDGETRLYLIKGQRMELDDEQAVLICFEPMPKSRYITDTPNIPYSVIKRYRHYGNAQPTVPPQQGASAASDVAADRAEEASAMNAVPPFPALAALPVAMGPSFGSIEGLCVDDPQRLGQVFPGIRATSDGLAPSIPPSPVFPLVEDWAVPGAPPPMLLPSATPLAAVAPAPAQHLPAAASLPSPGKDVPFLDDEMISDLIDRLN